MDTYDKSPNQDNNYVNNSQEYFQGSRKPEPLIKVKPEDTANANCRRKDYE